MARARTRGLQWSVPRGRYPVEPQRDLRPDRGRARTATTVVRAQRLPLRASGLGTGRARRGGRDPVRRWGSPLVGTQWSVTDTAAADVLLAFYHSLALGMTAGAAMLCARRTAREK